MNKFLNFCFKFGKWFVSIILVLLLITGIYLGVSVIKNDLKADSYKMDYKWTTAGITDLREAQTKKPVATEQVKNTYNDDIIKAFGDNKPTDKFVAQAVRYIENIVEERDIKDFINNLPDYYETVKANMFEEIKKEYKVTDEEIQKMYKAERDGIDTNIIERYASRYQTNVSNRNFVKSQALTARNAALMALLVTLGLFIVALIVPVLIKIEENTRK